MGGDGQNGHGEGWGAFYAALARLKKTVERLKDPAVTPFGEAPERPASPSPRHAGLRVDARQQSLAATPAAADAAEGGKDCSAQEAQEWMPEDCVVAEDDLPVLDPWRHDSIGTADSLEDGSVHPCPATTETPALQGCKAREGENAETTPIRMDAEHACVEPLPISPDMAIGTADTAADIAEPIPAPTSLKDARSSAQGQQPHSQIMPRGEPAPDAFSPDDAVSSGQQSFSTPEPHVPSVMDKAGWNEHDALPASHGRDEWEMLEGLHDASVSIFPDVGAATEAAFMDGLAVVEPDDANWLEHDLPDAVDDAREDPFAAHAGGAEAPWPGMLDADDSPSRSRVLDLALEIADLLEDLVTHSRIVEAVAWLEAFFLQHPAYRTREAIYRLAVSGCTFSELRQTIALRNLFVEAGWNVERRFDRMTWTWNVQSGWPPTYAQALELVRARGDYPLDMMVDTGWLDEWLNLQPGAAGFSRFIDFACMKAGIQAEVDDLPLFAENGGDTCAEDNGWQRRLHLSCPQDRDDPAPPLKHVLSQPRSGMLISLPPPGDI